jgi:hypothetical protein
MVLGRLVRLLGGEKLYLHAVVRVLRHVGGEALQHLRQMMRRRHLVADAHRHCLRRRRQREEHRGRRGKKHLHLGSSPTPIGRHHSFASSRASMA